MILCVVHFSSVFSECSVVLCYREKVHIEVTDVDDNDPKWKQEAVYSKVVDVPEGRMLSNILQLEVEDKDGSDKYSSVCRFHILSTDAPFTIDEDGE